MGNEAYVQVDGLSRRIKTQHNRWRNMGTTTGQQYAIVNGVSVPVFSKDLDMVPPVMEQWDGFTQDTRYLRLDCGSSKGEWTLGLTKNAIDFAHYKILRITLASDHWTENGRFAHSYVGIYSEDNEALRELPGAGNLLASGLPRDFITRKFDITRLPGRYKLGGRITAGGGASNTMWITEVCLCA